MYSKEEHRDTQSVTAFQSFFSCLKHSGIGSVSDLATCHTVLKLRAGHGFMLQKEFHYFHQLVPVLAEDLFAMGICPIYQRLHFIVDGTGHLFGITLGGLIITADEHLIAAQVSPTNNASATRPASKLTISSYI